MGVAVAVIVSLLLQLIAAQLSGTTAMLLGIFICLVSFVLAAVPVWHYTNTHQLTIPAGTGAGIGAITLIIAGIIGFVLQYAIIAIGLIPDPQIAALDQMEASGMTQEQIEMALRFSSPLISATIGIVVSAVIGAIGGAIGAAMFKKGQPEPEGF